MPPVSRRRAPLRTLALVAALACTLGAQAQAPAQPYDLPAQPLGSTLARIAAQSGQQISVEAELVRGLQAPAVRGSLSAEQAARAALAGSGLELVRTERGNWAVRRVAAAPAALPPAATAPGAANTAAPAVLPEMRVTAQAERADALPAPYAGGQVARGGRVGLLGNQDFLDTPVSIASYTAKLIEDQQPRTVGELLARNDASVRIVGGDTSSTESTLVRGFSLSSGSDYALNGLPGLVAQYRSSTEFIERAEVLKGPSAMLGGMAPSGGSGGSINLVTKRAQDEPLTRLTTSYLSDSRLGLHADVGRRFGENKEWGIRFNGAWRKGDTARDDQHEKRWLASLGLDYRSDRLRVSLDAIDQESHQRGARGSVGGIAAVGVLPAAPDGRRRLDQPWTMLKNADKAIAARAEYDFSSDLSAWLSVGHGDGRYSGKGTLGGNLYLVNAAGDTRLSDLSHSGLFHLKTVTADVGLRGQLRTGDIRHSWSLNANSLKRETGSYRGIAVPQYFSNLYHPVAYPAPVFIPQSPPDLVGSDTKRPSVALADTLSFADERVLLTLGVRRQSVKSRNYNTTTGAVTSSYDESATTPFIGLVVKPWGDLSLYANHVQGLSPGQSAPATAANAGEVFPPYKTKQYEVGLKYDLGSFATTVSLFQIDRPSASLGADNVFAINGEQRNRGLELSAFGEVARGVRLLGGVTLLNAKLTQTPTGANEGNRAIGTSKVAANLGVEWDVPALTGLTLTAGAVHTGGSYVDVANRVRAPGWTRTDLGLRYQTRLGGKSTILRATLENALDKAYWAISTGGGAELGAPRTFLLSATVDF